MERSVKLLLTLLVLLSGFAGVPAQARPCGGAGSGIEQVQPTGGSGAQSIAAAATGQRAVAQPLRAEREAGSLPPQVRVLALSVQKGDRALE